MNYEDFKADFDAIYAAMVALHVKMFSSQEGALPPLPKERYSIPMFKVCATLRDLTDARQGIVKTFEDLSKLTGKSVHYLKRSLTCGRVQNWAVGGYDISVYRFAPHEAAEFKECKSATSINALNPLKIHD